MSDNQRKSVESTELPQEELDQVTGGIGEIVISKPTDTTSPK